MKHLSLILVLLTACYTQGQISSPTSAVTAEPLSLPTSTANQSLEEKQKQLKQLERQLEDMKKQIKQKQPPRTTNTVVTTPAPQQYPSSFSIPQIRVNGVTQTSPPHLLVVPRPESTPEVITNTVEDMRIMTRILEKELKEFNLVSPQVFVPFGQQANKIKGLYLDGYGLVFQLQVDIPLIGQEDTQTQTHQEQVGDKVWHSTRQELFEPQPRHQEKKKQKNYDPAKVERLREIIAKTLKHATNIRSLNDREAVTVIVTSQTNPQNSVYTFHKPHSSEITMMGGGFGGMMGGSGHSQTNSGTSVLTIKATKTDIDAFATKGLTLEDFHNTLQTSLY